MECWNVGMAGGRGGLQIPGFEISKGAGGGCGITTEERRHGGGDGETISSPMAALARLANYQAAPPDRHSVKSKGWAPLGQSSSSTPQLEHNLADCSVPTRAISSALKAQKPHANHGPPSDHVAYKHCCLHFFALMPDRPVQMSIRQQGKAKRQHADIQDLSRLTPEQPSKRSSACHDPHYQTDRHDTGYSHPETCAFFATAQRRSAVARG